MSSNTSNAIIHGFTKLGCHAYLTSWSFFALLYSTWLSCCPAWPFLVSLLDLTLRMTDHAFIHASTHACVHLSMTCTPFLQLSLQLSSFIHSLNILFLLYLVYVPLFPLVFPHLALPSLLLQLTPISPDGGRSTQVAALGLGRSM